MLGRLFLGILKGLLVGGVVFAALVFGLKVALLPALVAYPVAVATGALTGLVAGKPIWSRDGKIEAGLKSVVGALLGGAAMWAMLRWLGPHLPVATLEPLVKTADPHLLVLPLIAMTLGMLFELDNTPAAPEKARVAELPEKRARVADLDSAAEEAAEEEVVPRSRAKR